MDEIIRKHAHQTPDKEAIVEGSTSLTYSELLEVAEKYAHALSLNSNLDYGEFVGILLPPGLKQVVAQVAIRLAGAVCVPLGVSQPAKRIKSMLQDIHVDKLLIDGDLVHEFPEFFCVPLQDVLVDTPIEVVQAAMGDGASDVKNKDLMGQCSHVLFTSGSTGKPKPVPIMESSILHLSFETKITPLSNEDRVTEFNNPGFDLSLFEIWTTLLSGAAIIVVPQNVVTDAGALSSFLRTNRVTATIMPTALFNIIVSALPQIFHELRHVLVAGEAANVHAMRSVLESQPPQHLWNAYGPTECTTMATLFEVTLAETDRGKISIGFPVGRTQVFLLDDHQQIIGECGTRGEICIAGPGVSPGYLYCDTGNAEKFPNIKCQSTADGDADILIRVHRTGDVGVWRGDMTGCLDFVGRMDNQVKHHGFRMHLCEIESTLQSDDSVASAVVLQQTNHDDSFSLPSLVAYVSMRKGNEDTSREALLRIAKENLPPYMVPGRIEILASLPLTPNGKVDKKALLDQREGDTHKSTTVIKKTDQRSTVIQIWRNALGFPRVSEDDDFFSLGGDSIQAAAFLAALRHQAGRIVSMDELYRYSRLGKLLHFLELSESGHGAPVDDTLTWKNDIDIIDTLSLVPDWESDREGKVFLTGATGFVGVNMLHHLLHRPAVKQVVCLVRRKGGRSGVSRVQMAMDRYGLISRSPEAAQKLLVLEGDMADDDLGLGQEQFDWLTSWASVVFHVGAKVNFCESYQQHYRSNVLGTKNVLRVAAEGRRKAFHYMSSIDVWGPTGHVMGTREVFEDEPLLPHVQALRYDLGYAQSQWTAEGMVRRMRERGLPVAIYRPGFIIGDSQTGASNPDDFVSRFIVGCIQMGTFPRIVDMRFEYATIDFVVAATMHIAAENRNLGHSYHILSPDQALSLTVEETCDLLNRTGYTVKMIAYDTWVQQVLETQLSGSPLAPLIPLFQEQVLGRLTRWEAGQYSPRYNTANTTRALADRPDIQYVPFTKDVLQRSIAFWAENGFYRL